MKPKDITTLLQHPDIKAESNRLKLEDMDMTIRQHQILLVEDNKLAMLVNTKLLQEIGCVVDMAENCEQALSMALTGNHDLIFMDIGLPDGNGIDVTKAIRKAGKKTPIVALTCFELNDQDQIEKKCLDAEMNGITRKPTTPEILQGFITRLC